jgi:N-acetylneuraminic acid mutarotase
VLVAGGSQAGLILASAEIYDPATGKWKSTGQMDVARYRHAAVALGNGKAMVVGGFWSDWAVASVETYDPATGAWSHSGELGTARSYLTATLLRNGDLLVVGGWDGSRVLNTAELGTLAVG